MRRLFLVQHGEAKSEAEDPERDLTERGFRDVENVARFAAGSRVMPSVVMHSPKKRAASTAAVLADYFKPADGVSVADGLGPNDDPVVWAARIAERDDDIMLVGHLPHMERLAAFLVTGQSANPAVSFSMGAVVCLVQNEVGEWAVGWMVVPDFFD